MVFYWSLYETDSLQSSSQYFRLHYSLYKQFLQSICQILKDNSECAIQQDT